MAARTPRVQDLLARIQQRAEGNDPRQGGLNAGGMSQTIQDMLTQQQQQAPPGQMGQLEQLPSGALNPVPGAQLTDTFGAPRGGGSRSHKGIDIFGDVGTPIVAPTAGISDRGGYYNDLGGHSVSFMDEQGNRHYFTHMDRPSGIKKGQQIQPGQVIGYVGNSGNAASTPSHVHYSINEGRGNVINAFDFLTGGN